MIRIIGDCHGKHGEYLDIIKDCEYSIQLGDFGFDYSCLEHVDPNKHRIIKGNHDLYDESGDYPHFLPSYGPANHGGLEFFYIRGAFSIDRQYRELKYFLGNQKTVFDNEELSLDELYDCIEQFSETKPSLVLSHECPSGIMKSGNITQFGYSSKFDSRTQIAMKFMHAIYAPKSWIFGHWHRSITNTIEGTKFQCLNELEFIDLKV